MKTLKTPNALELLKKIDQFKENVPVDIKPFFDSNLWLTRVRRELGVDLRDMQLRRDRSSSNEALFEAVRPLGTIGHIMPGNSDWTPLLAILETSIVGNTSWVKLPSGSDTKNLQSHLAQLGLTESVAIYTERSEVMDLYKKADAISAWGSEGSLEEIRKNISPQTRFIAWGHRISFAYLTDWNDQAAPLAQAIVKYEQQACSSPQVAYLEGASFEQANDFAGKLALELDKYEDSFPALEDSQWAELSNFTETHRTETCLKEKNIIEGKNQTYRIVVDMDATFEASVLNRTILIKTISKGEIAEVLAPHRRLLQSAGISCLDTDLSQVSEELINAGVSRVCPIDLMQDAHPLEPHDGEFSLSRFTRRVAVHAPQRTTNVISGHQAKLAPLGPISNKNDFASSVSKDGDYFFKSGGSSGKAILSPFLRADYHLQMQVAADGLIAAGLDPANDRCMNLFFGGGLYGGFLSFTDILEKTGAPQYPMGGYLDHDFVIETICDEKVNVLLGMPSYIVTLFKRACEKDIKLPVHKIYFGGEPFSLAQREWLSQLGVELIRSASYGSVDAGPLGYQCPNCEAGVHHVNTSIQHIEIVDFDKDCPVKGEEVGRVLVTSLARSGVTINRYQLGDTAKWVNGPCPCGETSPRLKLIGRMGDIFKLGGSFFNIQKLAEQSGCRNIQFQVTQENMLDTLVLVSPEASEQTLQKLLLLSDLNEIINLEKSAFLNFKTDGMITASSGKKPLLIDLRQ